MKKRCRVDKYSQEGLCQCNVYIANKPTKNVEAQDELGSKCFKDTSSTSKAQEDTQGSSYQPSLDGDENTKRLQDDVEIFLGSKILKKPYPT